MKIDKYVIGIDVGFRNMGLSLFKVSNGKFKFIDCDVIQTNTKTEKKLSVTDLNIKRNVVLANGIIDFINRNINFPLVLKGKIKLFGAFEFPHGGSKSQAAVRGMSMSTSIVVTFFTIFNIPFENVKPSEVKYAVTGKKDGSKEKIIKIVSKMLARHEKKISKRLPLSKRSKKKFPPTYEHFADSVGAIMYMRKNSIKYKQFLKGKL